MNDSIYLGASGMNVTSSAKLCAVATSLKAKKEAICNHLNFLNEHIGMLSSEVVRESKLGLTEKSLETFIEDSRFISELNGFIAWCNEARKAYDEAVEEAQEITLDEWLRSIGKTRPALPEHPKRPEKPSEESVIEHLSVKERSQYLALEAKCAHFGKVVLAYNSALKAVYAAVQNPLSVDTNTSFVLAKSPSADVEVLESLFQRYQKEYQEAQSELNHLKAEVKKKLSEEIVKYHQLMKEAEVEFKLRYESYNADLNALMADFNTWQRQELDRVTKLKIVIPDMYQELYKQLNNVGNKIGE